MAYTPRHISQVASDCNIDKPIIVEVGGERVPLQHIYVVTQELIDEGTYKPHQIGTLVIDLDV